MDFVMMMLGIIFLSCYFFFTLFLLNKVKVVENFRFHIQKYGVLFDGLKVKAFFKRHILIQQDIRKVVFAASIIYLYEKQNTCISVLLVIQIIHFTVLSTKFPYRVSWVN